jgi:hypothetical protein
VAKLKEIQARLARLLPAPVQFLFLPELLVLLLKFGVAVVVVDREVK